MIIPKIFTIETFLGCNLRCPECATGTKKIRRPNSFLTFDNFKIIAGKIAPYAEYAFLHCWGEPLLNPDIIKIINYGQTLFPTQISTNGQNITPELADQLILSKTDICISLDGMTQETYEMYRVGGKIQKVFDAIDMFQDAQKKYDVKKPLQVQFMVFKHNEHQIKEFRAYCEKKNVVESLKPPAFYCNSNQQPSSINRYVRKISVPVFCMDLYNVFTILVDGSVVICCYDYNGETTFGNIFDEDVLTIYNNSEIGNMRQTRPEFCQKNCISG